MRRSRHREGRFQRSGELRSITQSCVIRVISAILLTVTDRSTTRNETDRDPWLTLAEVAAELRVNPSTVRLWVTQGRLPASRAGQRKWLVRRSELDRMLNPQPAAPATDRPADPARLPMPGDRLIFDAGGGEGEGSGG